MIVHVIVDMITGLPVAAHMGEESKMYADADAAEREARRFLSIVGQGGVPLMQAVVPCHFVHVQHRSSVEVMQAGNEYGTRPPFGDHRTSLAFMFTHTKRYLVVPVDAKAPA